MNCLPGPKEDNLSFLLINEESRKLALRVLPSYQISERFCGVLPRIRRLKHPDGLLSFPLNDVGPPRPLQGTTYARVPEQMGNSTLLFIACVVSST